MQHDAAHKALAIERGHIEVAEPAAGHRTRLIRLTQTGNGLRPEAISGLKNRKPDNLFDNRGNRMSPTHANKGGALHPRWCRWRARPFITATCLDWLITLKQAM
jgi:hypothetical protein